MATSYVSFNVTVTARVDADTERCDYGVKGSPVWDEIKPETMEVSGMEIEGFSLDAMPEDVREYLEEMACEAAMTKDEWHD